MRKQKRKSGNSAADQRLHFRCIDNTLIQNLKPLAVFCAYTAGCIGPYWELKRQFFPITRLKCNATTTHCSSKITFVIFANKVNYTAYFKLYKFHHENKSVQRRPPNTPLLYSKTGVYRGIHFFLFLIQNIESGYSLTPPH